MEMRVFGRTGMRLSVLGFGCGAVGGLMVRGDPLDQERTVARAIDPADVVWRLLTEQAGWEDFYDVRITNVVPPGPAVVGQRIYGETGHYLRFRLQFEFLKIDPAHHVLVLAVRLPFGISVREDMDCIPLNPTQCRVNYRCNFRLDRGRVGDIRRHRDSSLGRTRTNLVISRSG
jgi:hypothetical protein